LINDHGVNAAPFQVRSWRKTGWSRADYENLLFRFDIEHATSCCFFVPDASVTLRQECATSRLRGMWPPQQLQACYALSANRGARNNRRIGARSMSALGQNRRLKLSTSKGALQIGACWCPVYPQKQTSLMKVYAASRGFGVDQSDGRHLQNRF
jgi:hypothetical protein